MIFQQFINKYLNRYEICLTQVNIGNISKLDKEVITNWDEHENKYSPNRENNK